MSSFLKRYQATIIGIGIVATFMVIFVLVSVYGSWGEPTDSTQVFCEYIDTTQMIAEPINTWSNFFYIGAGLLILFYHDLERTEKVKKRNDFMAQDGHSHYIITYALLVIWIGFGSFLMHVTWRGQTGFLDVLSMNMFISGLFILSISMLFDLKPKYVYAILISISVINAILMNLMNPIDIFIFWVAFTFINEILLSLGLHSKIFKKLGARQIKRNSIFLVSIVALFLLGYYLWHFGLNDAPSCDPSSWWQWHSLWHFITAACTGLIFCYIRTEREIEN